MDRHKAKWKSVCWNEKKLQDLVCRFCWYRRSHQFWTNIRSAAKWLTENALNQVNNYLLGNAKRVVANALRSRDVYNNKGMVTGAPRSILSTLKMFVLDKSAVFWESGKHAAVRMMPMSRSLKTFGIATDIDPAVVAPAEKPLARKVQQKRESKWETSYQIYHFFFCGHLISSSIEMKKTTKGGCLTNKKSPLSFIGRNANTYYCKKKFQTFWAVHW